MLSCAILLSQCVPLTPISPDGMLTAMQASTPPIIQTVEEQVGPGFQTPLYPEVMQEALVLYPVPPVPKVEEPKKPQTISDLIVYYAEINGADVNLALNVACAESCTRNSEGQVMFNSKAKNPSSSASGVYQFVNGTWRSSCKGDVLDAEDNIKCGTKILATAGGIHHWEASRSDGFGGGWSNRPYKNHNVIN